MSSKIDPNLPELTPEEFLEMIVRLTDPSTDQSTIPELYQNLTSRVNFVYFVLQYISGNLVPQTSEPIILNFEKYINSIEYKRQLITFPDYFPLLVQCFENRPINQDLYAFAMEDNPSYLEYYGNLCERVQQNPTQHGLCLLLFGTHFLLYQPTVEYLPLIIECIQKLINEIESSTNEFEVARSIFLGLQAVHTIINKIPSENSEELFAVIVSFAETLLTRQNMNDHIGLVYKKCYQILHQVSVESGVFQEILPLNIQAITYTAMNYKDNGNSLIVYLLKLISLEFEKIDFTNEIVDSIIHMIVICAPITNIEEMKVNPEQFYTSLFERDFCIYKFTDPCIQEYIGHFIFQLSEIDLGMTIESLFETRQDEESPIFLKYKIFLFYSLIQCRINEAENDIDFSEDFQLISVKLNEMFSTPCPDGEDEEIFQLFIYLLHTLAPIVTDDFSPIVENFLQYDKESIEGTTKISLFFRLVYNSLTLNQTFFQNVETLEIIMENKEFSLGNDFIKAYSALAKHLPNECAAYVNDYISSLLDELQSVIEIAIESRNAPDNYWTIISSLYDVIKNIPDHIDLAYFFGRYISFIPDLINGDLDIVSYFEIFPLFANSSHFFYAYIEAIFQIFKILKITSYLDDICRPFAVGLSQNMDLMKEEIGGELGNKTYAALYLENAIERLSHLNPVHDDSGGGDQVIFQIGSIDYNEVFSVDYESILLIAIQIIQKVEVPQEYLQALCQVIVGKLNHSSNQIQDQIISCELFASLLPIHPELVPQEIIDLMYELSSNGYIQISYHRALFGTAFLYLSTINEEKKEEYQQIGIAILHNDIPLNQLYISECRDFNYQSYPDFKDIPMFQAQLFVASNIDDSNQPDDEEDA